MPLVNYQPCGYQCGTKNNQISEFYSLRLLRLQYVTGENAKHCCCTEVQARNDPCVILPVVKHAKHLAVENVGNVAPLAVCPLSCTIHWYKCEYRPESDH